MTREEYNNRTNANASEEEFYFLNRIYMAAGDNIDKDQFCKDIKRTSVNSTIVSLTERVENSLETISDLKQQLKDLSIFIAKQAEKNSSNALRKKAIAMMGEREYLTWKIDNGISLWQLDLDLIKELINNQ